MKLCDDYCVIACMNCTHFKTIAEGDFHGNCKHPERDDEFQKYNDSCDKFTCIHYKEG